MPQDYRVGIVGRSAAGQFLLERLSFLPHWQTVWFQPAETPSDPLVQTLGCQAVTDWETFLTGSSLNAVLFVDGETLPLRQVEEALQAGHCVGFPPPFKIEPDDWRNLTADTTRSWRILNPHHEDLDFQSAMASLQSGEFGPIQAIKRISWVGELVVREDARPSVPDTWLSQLLWEDVDQLLHLAGECPRSVYTLDFSTDPASYHVVFQFPQGCIGHLERRRGLGIPLEIGWTIGSATGGYSNGHRHIKTVEGEIYDVPVELPSRVAEPLREPLENLVPITKGETAARHVLRVFEVLQAIKQSIEIGQAVTVTDPSM